MNNFHQLILLKKKMDRKQNEHGGGKRPDKQEDPEKNEEQGLPGYPHYPDDEDVYRQEKKEEDIDPEDPTHKKISDSVRNDLDVPGSELDDADEDIGNEDEENNFYSIGGDNHGDLEENRDEDVEGLNN